MYSQDYATKASTLQTYADAVPHSPTTGPLASIDSAISEAMCDLDGLELRLGICLRGSSPTANGGVAKATAIAESELIGRLYSIHERIDLLSNRIRDVSGRVTL